MGDEVKAEVDVVKADLSDFMSNVKLDGAGDQQKDTNENCEKSLSAIRMINTPYKTGFNPPIYQRAST